MRELIIRLEDKTYNFKSYSHFDNDEELLVLVNADIKDVKEEIDNLNKCLRVLSKRRRELKLLETFKACVERDIKNSLQGVNK